MSTLCYCAGVWAAVLCQTTPFPTTPGPRKCTMFDNVTKHLHLYILDFGGSNVLGHSMDGSVYSTASRFLRQHAMWNIFFFFSFGYITCICLVKSPWKMTDRPSVCHIQTDFYCQFSCVALARGFLFLWGATLAACHCTMASHNMTQWLTKLLPKPVGSGVKHHFGWKKKNPSVVA